VLPQIEMKLPAIRRQHRTRKRQEDALQNEQPHRIAKRATRVTDVNTVNECVRGDRYTCEAGEDDAPRIVRSGETLASDEQEIEQPADDQDQADVLCRAENLAEDYGRERGNEDD
jgi:hypothetical protein